MKKVVVVVDENQKELFRGKELKVEFLFGATDIAGYKSEPKLVIKEGFKLIAEFQTWMYWRETD